MNTKLFTQYPNKYKLTPKSITKLVIMDWERLKEKTWQNEAMTNGTWYCHLEGCQEPNSNKNFNDEDEFWIGFREDDNKVDFHFTCYGGMCGYEFEKFYDMKEIENWMDLNVQVNTIRWLTSMIDDGILAIKKAR
jgi:hypothetical protein